MGISSVEWAQTGDHWVGEPQSVEALKSLGVFKNHQGLAAIVGFFFSTSMCWRISEEKEAWTTYYWPFGVRLETLISHLWLRTRCVSSA